MNFNKLLEWVGVITAILYSLFVAFNVGLEFLGFFLLLLSAILIGVWAYRLKHKGILNIGGKTRSVYNFAKGINKKVKSIKAKKFLGRNIPLKHSMNLKKLNKIIND